jgi:hypothetical protein
MAMSHGTGPAEPKTRTIATIGSIDQSVARAAPARNNGAPDGGGGEFPRKLEGWGITSASRPSGPRTP